MKQLVFLFLLSIVAINGNAQKIKIKKDIVYVDKAEYCKTDCNSILVDDCKIFSLRNEALATIIFHSVRDKHEEFFVCEVIFSNSLFFKDKDYRAQVKMEEFKYREQIIRELYHYKAIQFGQLDELGVQNFVNAFSTDYLAQDQDVATNEEDTTANKKKYGYQIVERDISQKIIFFGTMMQQDLREIGTYKLDFFDEDRVKKQRISFHLMDGTLVATAVMDRYSDDNQCELTTTKDNQTKTITVVGLYTDQRVEFIANYLIKEYYL